MHSGALRLGYFVDEYPGLRHAQLFFGIIQERSGERQLLGVGRDLGRLTVASYLRPLAWKFETIFMPIEIWDSLALMLLGLALYQWGFLSGQWSNRDYGKVVAIGYGIGLPLAIYSFYHSYLYSPNLEASLRRMELVPIEWVGLIYPFQRIFLVMAHVAALIVVVQIAICRKRFSDASRPSGKWHLPITSCSPSSARSSSSVMD